MRSIPSYSLIVLGIICISLATAKSFGETEAELELDGGLPVTRVRREVAVRLTHQYTSPSRSCAHAYFNPKNYCGDLTSGHGGGCNMFCALKGFAEATCRKADCVCHDGDYRLDDCQEPDPKRGIVG